MICFAGFGHSHIVALAQGCYALTQRGERFQDQILEGRFHYLYGEELTPAVSADGLNPKILEKIAEAKAQFVLLSLGGNEHSALSIVQRRERFDFILGAAPDLPLEPGATILPEAVIRETLREAMEEIFATLRAFRDVVPLPLIQIEPPPPLPGEKVLSDPVEFFHTLVDANRLSTDCLRYKMWRVQVSLYREFCERLNVGYAPIPADFFTEDGMLAPFAWSKDATHANVHFGERMILEALSLLATRLQPSG
jgi:hypothetical protein